MFIIQTSHVGHMKDSGLRAMGCGLAVVMAMGCSGEVRTTSVEPADAGNGDGTLPVVEATDVGVAGTDGEGEGPVRLASSQPVPLRCAGQTATSLGGGRVLVVGACWFEGEPFAAGVYNVADGALTPVELVTPTVGHTATVLDGGDVLVTGGFPIDEASWWLGNAAPLSRTLVFEEASVGFVDASPMRQQRGWHTATRLPSGEVIVAGGKMCPIRVTDTAERYDGDSWTGVGSLTAPRAFHHAALLDTGDGLAPIAAGGTDGEEQRGPVERFTEGEWQSMFEQPSAPPMGDRGVLARIPDGVVIAHARYTARATDGSTAWEGLGDPAASFFPSAAMWIPGADVLLVAGLGYYGGLGVVALDGRAWVELAFPQVAGPTTMEPITLTPLDEPGVVLAIGDDSAAVVTLGR